jgi:hypothetical protein
LLGLGVAALAVVAAVLAFAGGGRAASGNICLVNSGTPPTTPASCVTETVGPHFISSSASSAISFTKFHNEAIGGATATHVLLAVTFPDAATVDSAAVWVEAPGATSFTQLANPSCATTTNSSGQTVESCAAGNVAGGGRAKMIVQFHGSAGGQLNAEVTYGEGGGGPSNPPNDDQINHDTLFVGSSPDTTAGTGGCGNGGSASGTLGGQTTQVTVGTTSDPTLPCTYFDAGVRPASEGAGHTLPLSFFEFPTLPAANPYGTVTVTFPSTYKVNNKTLVDEDTTYTTDPNTVPYFTTFITLASCDRNGNIVVDNKTTFVGTPTQGETNTTVPRFYDACIFDRLPSTNQVVLHVLSNPLDQTVRGH